MNEWWRPRSWCIALVRLYQRFISPHTPACCRFVPCCSAYAVGAFRRYGAVIGIVMTAWRLLRCNPLFPGGYDPVPEKIAWPGKRKKKDGDE